MTLPAGIETRTARIRVPLDTLGQAAKFYSGSIRPNRALIWAATGDLIWAVGAELPDPEDGYIAIEVPVVDQAGFVTPAGDPITGWSYFVTVTGTWPGTSRTTSRTFQVVEASPGVVDVDLLPDSSASPPVVEPDPYVQSFAGHTGTVTAEQVYGALTPPLLDDVTPIVQALVPGEVADAVDGHVPGSSLAYAVRNSSLTTTEVFPAVAAIASLALTVTGAGRPVEVEFYVPEIYHSVVNARPGIGIAYQRDSIYVGTLRSVSKRSYSTTEGDQLFVKSQIVLDDGIDYFFYPVFGAFSAGTTSLKVSGATGGPVMTMSVVSR